MDQSIEPSPGTLHFNVEISVDHWDRLENIAAAATVERTLTNGPTTEFPSHDIPSHHTQSRLYQTLTCPFNVCSV